MNYQINTKIVPLELNKIVEVELSTLCKILEVNSCTDMLEIVYLERWGGSASRTGIHKLILMEPGIKVEYTQNYEQVFSRRGKVIINGKKYYVFTVS